MASMEDRISFNPGDALLGPDSFPKQISDVGPFVSTLAKNAIVIAGIIFVILIIAGGVKVITSAGNNDPQNVAKGKQAATAGVIGFMVVFISYWIIQAIEVLTGIDIF